ncbi:hypothetical protein [Flaviaesturariibacter amylovorans]|uniref:Uncharacterized protein n=1 Tax=Flaviaesturariibacter amylovorans TaxID=1084520 RepID=A0ABP8H2W2_9BACT
MKQFYGGLFLLSLAGTGHAQTVDLNDLLNYTSYTVQKFDSYLSKKAYHRDYESPRESKTNYNYVQVKKKRGEEVTRKFSFLERPDAAVISFQTTSLNEFNDLTQDLRRKGFHTYEPATDPAKPVLYQHDHYTVNTSVEIRDSVSYYTMQVERALLPKLKDIEFAEDLLPFASHEYLVSTFGPGNVSKDVFHYTEDETNKCSVIFPNTPREVIFIWDDETNYRNVSFLIIGGHVLTHGTAGYNNQITENVWRSKQGVFAGMKLQELQELNGGQLSFYGWNSERAGMLAENNRGKIDFNRLGMVLSCLNCVNNPAYETNTVNSDKAVADDRKIYVSSLIVIPDKPKEKSATAAR